MIHILAQVPVYSLHESSTVLNCDCAGIDFHGLSIFILNQLNILTIAVALFFINSVLLCFMASFTVIIR